MSEQDNASRDMLRGILVRSLEIADTPEFANIIFFFERADNVVKNSDPEAIRQPPLSTKSPEGLGEFDGTHAKWPQFRDLFSALVGSQDYLNMNKLLYLKNACAGPAALAIRGYEPAQDCYEEAWKALDAIYEDDYAVTQALIDRLVNMSTARDIGVIELRRTIDTTTSTLRQLSSLKEEPKKLKNGIQSSSPS